MGLEIMGIMYRKVVGLALGVLALSALSACDEMGQLNLGEQLNLRGSGGDTADDTAIAPTAGPTDRDVEAPDVFSVTAEGLWDGRPSLGGIWVAHPDVEAPERVLIRNLGNGRSVTGALFRRESDLPGPDLQISSDAAEALGLVAGTPQDLNVIALRRAEASSIDGAAEDADAADDAAAPQDADAVMPPADVTETTLDPLADAEAETWVDTSAEVGAGAGEDPGRTSIFGLLLPERGVVAPRVESGPAR